MSRSFNPRTRVGCDVSATKPFAIIFCFNPRTRVGCDRLCQSYDAGTIVSIHAPAWGATHRSLNTQNYYKFQSTHPRGVRLAKVDVVVNFGSFQSTHPRGVRLCRKSLKIEFFLFQSTHPRGVRL